MTFGQEGVTNLRNWIYFDNELGLKRWIQKNFDNEDAAVLQYRVANREYPIYVVNWDKTT